MSDTTLDAARPHFSQPTRQILIMLVVVGVTVALIYQFQDQALELFNANRGLNGVILGVFGIGVLACFLQVFQLSSAVRWLEEFAATPGSADPARAPRLMASVAGLLRGRGAQSQIGTASSNSILDSVATRLDEARDITRYIINLLIFLGLLGTFYGLATTVPAVVRTIESLNVGQDAGVGAAFDQLMTGLKEQLGGMGTAFTSSLLGLAGSLVVGLLELFAGHGQNRFYRELEEWLTTITRVGFASGEVEGGSFDTGVVAQVLDHMAEQMDALQQLFLQSEESRRISDQRLVSLASAMEKISGQVGNNGPGISGGQLDKLAQGQERLAAAIEASNAQSGEHVDAESRMRLRSIDVQLLRILEEMAAGRQESVAELRGELASLNRALRQGVGQGSQAGARRPSPQANAEEALRAALDDDDPDDTPRPPRNRRDQG